ncbi:MAG: BNR/Asp-box repeat protein [Gemmatimonadetes bacterium]|nr:BNR/Asp-box repeat protein [Gemmatimonadota bacterium]
MTSRSRALAALLVSAFPPLVVAQQPATVAPRNGAAVPERPDSARPKGIPWRSVGPANNAGRISVVVGVPGNRDVYYVAGANGGIIKTTNGGVTFKPIFDKQDVGSIGAIAIAPSDPNVIYVGSGEGNPRNNASVGDGVYKSIDAGEHWTHIGLAKSDKIARIVIDSKDPERVYACALGREWGPNEERGVFKTTDGGKSWSKVLYVDASTSCSDISTDPNNSNILFAGMYTYRRWAWHLESGGGKTAVYRSVDGGASWERLSGNDRNRGLPLKEMDRIGVAVAPSDPSIVYVVSETKDEGELWRSDDGGDRWRMVNKDPNINFRPFYYSDIRVDPQNPNRVFSLSGSLYLSEDGGANFRTIARDVHGDHQAMWIDPLNPKYLLSGSDGGWQVSYDAGKNFEVVNTFPFTQFYHIAYDMQKPYMVCGGLQDNGNWCGPSQTASGQGNRKNDWYTVSGGDGFFTVPVMDKPWLVYSDAQGGMLNLTDTRTGAQKTIYPYPNRVGSVGDAMVSHKYRFNWNSPIALSPINPGVVYFGGNVLFKSTDHGMSWKVISPDLTTNDPAKQQSSGGPIVVDNTAAEFHTTLLTIAPSPLDSNVIWTGSDDGNVQVTRDGGKSWSNVFVNVPGLKPNAWIPAVEASHYDAGTAYVAADHHQDDDYSPHAYMTTDFGKSWKRITGDLPASASWVHVVREDPKNRNLLYIGTEMGVWASWDRGAHWESLRGELPVTPVRDIQIHPRDNDLLLATHGRGLYILDDIGYLQQRGATSSGDVTMFDVRPAVRWSSWNRDGNLGQKKWSGENPPAGALVTYRLASQPPGEVNLTITDRNGRVVRRMRRVSDDAGLNRVAWDLRMDPPPTPAPAPGAARPAGATAPDTSLAALRARRAANTDAGVRGGDDEESFFRAPGAAVLPGTYTATLTVNGQKYSKPIQVELDPRSDMTAEQLAAQSEASARMTVLTDRVNRLTASIDDVSLQLVRLQEQLRRASRDSAAQGTDGASPAASPAVLADIDAAIKDLRHFRDSVVARPLPGLGYRQYPRLREEVQTVSGMIARPMMPVTAGESLRLGELQTEVDQAQARLDGILQGRVARINQALAGTPHVITTPVRRTLIP